MCSRGENDDIDSDRTFRETLLYFLYMKFKTPLVFHNYRSLCISRMISYKDGSIGLQISLFSPAINWRSQCEECLHFWLCFCYCSTSVYIAVKDLEVVTFFLAFVICAVGCSSFTTWFLLRQLIFNFHLEEIYSPNSAFDIHLKHAFKTIHFLYKFRGIFPPFSHLVLKKIDLVNKELPNVHTMHICLIDFFNVVFLIYIVFLCIIFLNHP